MKRYLILISVLCLFAVCHSMAQVNQMDGNFIKDWLILGPFSGNDIDQDYLASVGGEANAAPKAGDIVKTAQSQTLTWSLYRSPEDVVDLLQVVGGHTNVTAYAFCHLQGERDLDTEILLGSDDGVAVWFNGKLVHKNDVAREVVADQDAFPMQVTKGKNRLLFKITQGIGGWGLTCRIPAVNFSGQVLMSDGITPPANVTIELLKADQVIRTVLSDENGYYRILEAMEGNYWIRCRILNQNIYYNLAVDVHTPGTRAQEIMAEGNVVKGLDFRVLFFRDAINGKLLMLDNLSPHVNVVVQVLKDKQVLDTTLSDGQGNYSLSLLEKGMYTLRCHVLEGYLYYNAEAEVLTTQTMAGKINFKGQALTRIDFHFAPFKKGTWKHYDYLDGLASTSVTKIYQAEDHTLWIGTTNGLSHYDGESFTNLTTRDGLINNHISAIHQSSDGSIWFGTRGGVSHYDGQKFIDFTTEEGLVSNVVTDIHQSNDGLIWIATAGTGISRYDGQDFVNLTTQDGLISNLVNDIHQSQDGKLWFATGKYSDGWGGPRIGGGISYYDGNGFTSFTTDNGLVDNNVNAIHESQDGKLWLATGGYSADWGRSRIGGGVSHYDGNGFVNLTTENGLPSNNVKAIHESQDGSLWLATDQGVAKYYQERIVIFTTDDGLVDNDVVALCESNDGTMWFATRSSGLSTYNSQGMKRLTEKDGLVGNKIELVHQSKDGTIWFVSHGDGLSHYNGQHFTNYTTQNGLGDNNILSITEAHDQTMWFGHRSGVSSFDGKTFKTLSVADGLAARNVHAVYETKDRNMWFGVWGGQEGSLSRYDGKILKTFNRSDELKTNNVPTIYQSSDDSLWLATAGSGVFRYDGQHFTQFTTDNGLASNNVSWLYVTDSFIESVDGTIWCRSWEGPLSRYDGQQFTPVTTRDGIIGDFVSCMYKSRDGTVWFGTEGGVTSYDGRKFFSLSKEDGLADNQITAIYESEDGIMWFGTRNGGVSLYDGNTLNSLDVRNGLISNHINHIVGGTGGAVYFGNYNSRTDEVDFIRYKRSSVASKVVIDWVKTDELHTDLDSIPPIVSGNLVTFTFRSIDFKTMATKRLYQYHIREFHDWSSATVNNTYDYKFDQIGNYTFEVRGIDQDLRYSEIASVSVQIIPPWYLNGWIMFPSGGSILLVLILAIVNGVRYYQQQRESERLEAEAQQLRDQMLEQERGTRLALEAELADANQMQMSLLPEAAPVVEGLQIVGSSIATKEVGGDFFDYLISEDGLQISIAVGDVSGKGLRGAMNAVMSSGILRLASSENPEASMDLLMSKTNKALCDSMEQDMNVTMVLAQFDTGEKRMTLANAGQHAYPLLIRNGTVQPVKAKGLALGMIPSIVYKSTVMHLESGDLLLLMTDGITEPRNAEGVMYEESGRLNEVVSSISVDMPIEEVVDTIINDVEAYTADEEQDDDITLVAVRVS